MELENLRTADITENLSACQALALALETMVNGDNKEAAISLVYLLQEQLQNLESELE